jgi:hypothetical protein
VQTLNNVFSLTLTQEEALEFDDVWTTTRVQSVYDAVLAISQAYVQRGLSFGDVFGGTSMTMRSAAQSYCGLTPGTDNISWYQCSGFNDPYSRDNVIHELGHILQNRAGSINGFTMSGTWDAIERRSEYQDAITRNPGFGFATPGLRQNARAGELNPDDRLAEEVSDMFLFWVTGYAFSSGDDDNGQIGNLRSTFVNGGTIDFDAAVGGPIENPGIIGWSSRISGANTASAVTPKPRSEGLAKLCIDIPFPLQTLI